MSSQMQNHLRTYVENGIQQKIRLGNLIEGYEEQEHKSRERVIDEKELENKSIAQGIPQNKIDLIVERRLLDEEIFNRSQEILVTTREEMRGLTLRMNTHLEELTDIEVLAGGFVSHSVGVGKNAKYDRDSHVIKFEENGHVEIPIAARMSSWKDSSQLTINKIKKKAGA